MRIILRLFSLFAMCCVGEFFVDAVYAARVNPFSEYGQIQNVQTYSSNPLWNPYGPYNQTFPRPVYVDGPDLSTGDCQRTVFALISAYCAANNNCHGMQLADVRPGIMLQLSRLPGHNWATQCVGFIDGAFEQYLNSAQNQVPSTSVGFPQGTVTNNSSAEYRIENPFSPQAPEWAIEMQERKQELKQLQSENGGYDASVSYAGFPQTYDDLSFAEKIDIQQKGYEPYKDKSPYQMIKVGNAETKTNKPVSEPTPDVEVDDGDVPISNPDNFDCNKAVEQVVNAYFDVHPWGTVNAEVCSGALVATNDLIREINNFLKSNPQCKSHKFTKNGFYNWYKGGSKFYAKVNVYYQKSAGSYTVQRVSVKTCCDYSIDNDCLALE